jgi:hypothetical protein
MAVVLEVEGKIQASVRLLVMAYPELQQQQEDQLRSAIWKQCS